MQVDVLTLAVTTVITGIVGWLVRVLTAKLDAYMGESTRWRESVDAKLDGHSADMEAIKDATQTNMRSNLLHYAEKYLTRGWVTPEERASLYDMHQKYSALNANGYIDGYIDRVMALPDKEV